MNFIHSSHLFCNTYQANSIVKRHFQACGCFILLVRLGLSGKQETQER